MSNSNRRIDLLESQINELRSQNRRQCWHVRFLCSTVLAVTFLAFTGFHHQPKGEVVHASKLLFYGDDGKVLWQIVGTQSKPNSKSELRFADPKGNVLAVLSRVNPYRHRIKDGRSTETLFTVNGAEPGIKAEIGVGLSKRDDPAGASVPRMKLDRKIREEKSYVLVSTGDSFEIDTALTMETYENVVYVSATNPRLLLKKGEEALVDAGEFGVKLVPKE